MRRAAKVDATHADIVRAFRTCGAFVLDLSRVGCGCPDLLIVHQGVIAFVEVKTPTTRKRFTAAQRDFQQQCSGPYGVACSIEDVPQILWKLRHGVLGPMRDERCDEHEVQA